MKITPEEIFWGTVGIWLVSSYFLGRYDDKARFKNRNYEHDELILIKKYAKMHGSLPDQSMTKKELKEYVKGIPDGNF